MQTARKTYMRWYAQLAVIVVLGGAAYGTVQKWETVRGYIPEPVFAVIAPLLPKSALPPPSATAGARGQPPAGGPRPAGGPGGGQAPVVEVVTVGTGTVTELAEALGTSRAFESVTLNSKVSGIVQAISFTEGAKVSAGDELLRLDSMEREADLAAARAAIQQEEARRNELRTRLERAVSLRRSGAGTEALVDDLTAQMRTADSAVQNAVARERAVNARLNDMVIRAPFGGRVGIRQVSVGSYLENKTAITTLDDISRIRLDFQVPEALVGLLRTDSAVQTSAPAFGSRKFDGFVKVIDTRVDPVTRSVKLTAVIDNPSEELKPGMFMNVALTVARRENAVLIPEEAIVGEGPLHIAFTVKDNRIERKIVTLGQRETGKVEVKAGLAAGETLVVRGLQRVRAGMPVTPRPFGVAPPAGGPPSAGGAGQRPQAQQAPTAAGPAQASAPAPTQTR
jgi:membrane fusion protein (multidrug efflux system)